MTDYLSISVIVVTRNRARWLNDALESLARQIRQPDEVVVVDNGSGDGIREIVRKFSDTINITYVFEPAKGIPYARNAGIINTTGDIIAFMDDDCEADEAWLKHLEKSFIKDPNIGVVGGEVSYLRVDDRNLIEEFYIKNMIDRKKN